MKKVLLLGLILLAPTAAAWAGTCSGGANCTACKNCSKCHHCHDQGGRCSVCASGQPEPKAKAKARKPRR